MCLGSHCRHTDTHREGVPSNPSLNFNVVPKGVPWQLKESLMDGFIGLLMPLPKYLGNFGNWGTVVKLQRWRGQDRGTWQVTCGLLVCPSGSGPDLGAGPVMTAVLTVILSTSCHHLRGQWWPRAVWFGCWLTCHPFTLPCTRHVRRSRVHSSEQRPAASRSQAAHKVPAATHGH